ncbi:GntR family transcriptional regulator [Caballeronia sp. LjRoot29]|uniref:GntR family transcriptional regulator n=1 Tax=Caballeronia sp. LjRoot29 TaxID=3342315 RepID=UPI003ECE08A3
MFRRQLAPMRDPSIGDRVTVRSDASLSQSAYELLEEAIVTQQVAPGSSVSEAQLSELIGMSRMPTREAVRRLARENLLEVRPKCGITIRLIDPNVQLRLLETRREVERLMVRLIARECDAAAKATLRALSADFETAAIRSDVLLFVHADKSFNELCLSICGNEFVVGAMRLMQGPSRRFWFQRSRDAEILVESATLHAALAAAIASGDPDAAAHASDRLLDSAERFARRATEETGDALSVR